MPKRVFRKKRYYRKKKAAGYAVRKPGLMGLRPTFTHRYTETQSLTPGGSNDVYAFRLNSLNDPNHTGIGHQAMGFDQIKELYQHYCVLKVRAKVTIINTSTTVPIAAGVCVARAVGSYTNISDFTEQTNAKVRPLNNRTDAPPTQTTFNLSVVPRKWLGYKSIYSSNDLWGGYSANPVEDLVLNIFVSSQDEFSSPTYRFIVSLEYFAVWKEIKNINQS